MILIVTDSMDDTANAVVAGFNRLGARWGRFNLAEFPEQAQVVFDPAEPSGALILDEAGDAIEVKAIRTTWIWHPRPFKLVPGLDQAQARFVTEACRDTSRLMLALLTARSFMVNPPEAESAAQDKGLQLRLALGLGLPIPETVITNSPEAARRFCTRFPEVIFKLINRPRIDYGDRAVWISTNLLAADDIGALDQLRHCPGIFQRRIPKKFDLRITVVGNRVFPVEIHSQEDPRAAVDFRVALAENAASLRHVVHDLPPLVHAQVLRLTRKLGLHYCAIDMVVTPGGDYVFLEVNPSGQFGWIETRTSLPITEELVRMFIRGCP